MTKKKTPVIDSDDDSDFDFDFGSLTLEDDAEPTPAKKKSKPKKRVAAKKKSKRADIVSWGMSKQRLATLLVFVNNFRFNHYGAHPAAHHHAMYAFYKKKLSMQRAQIVKDLCGLVKTDAPNQVAKLAASTAPMTRHDIAMLLALGKGDSVKHKSDEEKRQRQYDIQLEATRPKWELVSDLDREIQKLHDFLHRVRGTAFYGNAARVNPVGVAILGGRDKFKELEEKTGARDYHGEPKKKKPKPKKRKNN
jgi:hypothetical protein